MNTLKKWIIGSLIAVLLIFGAVFLARTTSVTNKPVTALPPAATDEIPAAPQATVNPKEADEESEKAKWTVMLYLCGTDLESKYGAATQNLIEIAKTTPTKDVDLVIQTGGAKEWKKDETLGLEIATDKLQRYHFGTDGYKLIENLPLDNMASASTLTDFIQWGAKAYPAEKYLLVLWDHGGGSLKGLILDDLHKGIMPLDQLQIALEDADVPLEAVLTDACLMASLETAQALQSTTKYLIASEEIVPCDGTAYTQWLQFLYNTPDCSGARFGKEVCDTVQQKYMELGVESASKMLTFSVLDLSKIDAVSQAFDKMFLEISALLENPRDFLRFGYFTLHMQHYSAETMVDLSDLASRARNVSISNKTAGDVIEAVNDAVLYHIQGAQRSYSRGLSFYYAPAATALEMDHYARCCKNASYLAFLDATHMNWTAPAWVFEKTPRLKDISYASYSVQTAVSLNEEGLPQLTLTNAKNAVAAVDMILYQYDKKTKDWLSLGESGDVNMDQENGVYTAKLHDEWLTFGGMLCKLSIVEEMYDHTLYQIPFSIMTAEDEWTTFYLRTALIFDKPLSESYAPTAYSEAAQSEDFDPYAGEYELYGVWDQDSSSAEMPSRNVISLQDFLGAYAAMVHSRVDYPALTEIEDVLTEPFMLDRNVPFSTTALPKGEYAIAFKVMDVFGATQTTPPIEVSWNGKTATYTDPNAEQEN